MERARLARPAMWLANALTLARVPLAACLVVVLDRPSATLRVAAHPGEAGVCDRPAWALAIVIAAALSDAADGSVARWARRHGSTSTAGDWLDPAADKLFIVTAVVAIAWRAGAWPIAALIGARELVLVPLVLAYRLWPRRRLHFKAAWVGKIATDVQLVAIGVLVALPAYALPFAIAAGALGLAAVADYARRVMRGT